MKRTLRITAWILGVLLLIPVVLVAGVLVALNVAPGQRLVEQLAARFTGGQVILAGVSGRFPDAPRIARVEIHDRDGAWLVIEELALDWSPSRLLGRDALVQNLAARHVAVARLPESSEPAAPAAQPSSSSPFSLPVRVDVERLAVARLDLGAPVAGVAAAAKIDGQVHLTTLTTGTGDITLERLDGAGTYKISGTVDAARLAANLDVAEPAGGLLSGLARLPDLGALTIKARLDGPWSAAGITLALAAGPLRANAGGTIDLDHNAADLEIDASAPAMTPRPDVSWQSVALKAHVHGPFTTPEAAGTLRIETLAAAGASWRRLAADIGGNAGHVALKATIEGLRIPGPKPDLLEAAPVVLTAAAELADPARPVTFALTHPLLQADGHAVTAGAVAGDVALTLPALAPLAAIGGVDVQGHAALVVKAAMQGGTTTGNIDGHVVITGGMAPVPALLGDTTIGITAAITGQDLAFSRVLVDGRTLRLAAHGGLAGGKADLDWKLALSDLAVAAPTLSGRIDGAGHVQGPTNDFSATADIAGEVGGGGFAPSPVKLSIQASGLPAKPAGHVTGEGKLFGAPLSLAVAATRAADGLLSVAIERADWNSAHAEGALTLAPGATLPQGRLAIRMTRLDDLRPLIGRDLAGGITADIDLTRPNLVSLKLDAKNTGLPGTATVGGLSLRAEVSDPIGHPGVDANLVATAIQAGAIAGNARLDVKGPQEALALRLSSALQNVGGAEATVTAAATVDARAKNVAVAALTATWKGETLRLLAPTRIGFANGVTIDRLRLGLRQAVMEIAGKVSPTLDVTASLRNVTPDLARIFSPDIQADGILQADARITGTPARPAGTVKMTAAGLHMRTGPGRSLPAAGITADATLNGDSARVDIRLAAGTSTRLAIAGQAPLNATGPVDLHATGALDFALLDPILAAGGRRVRGQATLDATVTGSVGAPRIAGGIQVARGEIQDFSQGVHLTDVTARLTGTGDTVRIEQFSAKAGPGSITAAGSIGVLAADLPLDITVTARNARPLASDLLTATLDADLTVRGSAKGHLAAGGLIKIRSARIQVPEQIPTSIAVLDVRVPGQKPPPPPAPGPDIALDLELQAPQGIFVSGRGLDAELGGNMRVRGTAAAPLPAGGFELRRGQFSLAGTVLTFTTGEVTFNGASKIDPTLNFIASTTNGSVIATLTITGYASKPEIKLSSVPDLPQDEVLAQLLFHTSASNLSAFQLAEIAGALAQISGVTSGVDPLAKARKALGLDQLNVGTSSTGAPTLQAGRYVAKGVYVGAKQGTSGAGTQATVQIDITKGLKLETDAGSGAGANSVGLTYQFEY